MSDKIQSLCASIIESQTDLDGVRELLRVNNLPYRDLELRGNLFILYKDDKNIVIGSGGMEFYTPYALMRSIVVAEPMRGNAFGRKIVTDLLNRAKANSIMEVYLLTETAHDFFLTLDFADIDRSSVPEQIMLSSEFKSVCPATAACMVLRFLI